MQGAVILKDNIKYSVLDNITSATASTRTAYRTFVLSEIWEDAQVY